MQIRLLLILLLLPVLLSAQGTSKTAAPKAFSPRITTIFHKLGDGFVRIRSYQYGDAKEPYFIALHDDELTAITSTQKLLAKTGGILVRIDNNKQRNIKFKLGGKPYTFDPNRIFSDTGINQTLAMFGKITSTARDEVDKFAHRVLKLLPASPVFIISLHNNTNGRFSITSYLKGEDREKDAKTIRLVPNEDPDDLFLTTDSMFFEKLVKGNFNTILQDNANARKDGSLSIYCGEKNIPYLNCETEHGRLKQYDNMIGFAVKYLRTEKVKTQLPAFTYNYKLLPEPVTISLSKGDGIYFGEKKVGSISAATDKNSGRIEMLESFPLYDNMDFYIFSSGNGGHRIELRIDPTRSKKLVNREKDTIQMKVSN